MADDKKIENIGGGSFGEEGLFQGFVSLIAGMTMQQLGKIINPMTGKVERNLDVARAWIETLKMLKTKTKGNLTGEEQRFLDSTLATLQMNYVDEVRKPPEKAAEKKEESSEEKPGDAKEQTEKSGESG